MQDKGGVEGLKKKLYSRAPENNTPMQDVRAPLPAHESETPPTWSDSKPSIPSAEEGRAMRQASKPVGRWSRRFFWGAAVFFVLACGAAAYFFFGGSNFVSPNNIDLQIVTPSLIDGGAQTQLQFIVTNRNSSTLQLADLVITYPDGTRDPKDPTKPLPSERQSIGTIAPGQQIKRTSTAVFYGEEGSMQTVKAELEYSLANSNAIFVKDADTTFTVGSSPVSVVATVPQAAVSGEPFDITLAVRSNAQTAVQNVIVQAQYPFGFKAISTNPKSEAGGSFWRLGTMAPGASQTITVRGTIDGQDGDQRVFRFLAGSDADPTNTIVKTPFLSVPATLTVERPFITGSIAINGNTGATVSASAGKPVTGTINWQNNLSVGISNVEITLQLSGPLLDKSSVQSGTGFYQSQNNTITWTSEQEPDLAQVGPGGTGQLQFTFATLAPGQGGLYQNPTVDLSLTVKGTRADETGVPQEVSSVATTQVTLASAVTLAAAATATGGPNPPRAGSQSQYTITWTVKNSSNVIANANVSAVLPSYVDFVSGQSGVTYDAASRTVRWAMGDIAAGVGYASAARTVTFQVALNASASQVTLTPTIVGAAQLSGTDRFAQVGVSATTEALTTGAPVQ
ncbi:MAG: hypothetical protein V4474_02635 [Patescibacteria group bacterium]